MVNSKVPLVILINTIQLIMILRCLRSNMKNCITGLSSHLKLLGAQILAR